MRSGWVVNWDPPGTKTPTTVAPLEGVAAATGEEEVAVETDSSTSVCVCVCACVSTAEATVAGTTVCPGQGATADPIGRCGVCMYVCGCVCEYVCVCVCVCYVCCVCCVCECVSVCVRVCSPQKPRWQVRRLVQGQARRRTP